MGGVTECYTSSFSPTEGKKSKRLGLERYKSGQVRDTYPTHIPDKSNSPQGFSGLTWTNQDFKEQLINATNNIGNYSAYLSWFLP